MYATYRREYENFTYFLSEFADAVFQRFMVVVNNMRANVAVLPYDDHERAVKLLHSLDRTVWDGKVEAILESEKYDTLMVNELFSKLKSAELDRGVTAYLQSLTDSYCLAFSVTSQDTSSLTVRRIWRTKTATRTSRRRTTNTSQGVITSIRTSTRMSDNQGRRTVTVGRPERWSERATLTPAPPTLPRAPVAVKMTVISARTKSHPRT
jgi:hypothetical protein